ncbi:hypothetical protein [Haloglycomyces albus]|uniref:hypothetical protein n=1 Tax=Haloglycomyces albus TaxID=526067 RepID=UPI00046CF430|nr:hypothetical protein [Haloglycomyces albus]
MAQSNNSDNILSFDSLVDAATDSHGHGLPFTAKNGHLVHLRPIPMLDKAAMKVVQSVQSVISDDNTDAVAQLDAIDNVLIAVADDADSMRDSLENMPIDARTVLFEQWAEDVDLGETSA